MLKPKRPQRTQLMVFIDANAYLFLYEHYDPKLTELAEKISSARDAIFITRQIVNEIERNKLRVTRQVLDNATKSLGFPSGLPKKLPPGLNNHGGSLEEARKQIQEATRNAKNIVNDIKRSSQEHLRAVSESRDETSRSLQLLYGGAVDHSDEILRRARLRKELGNPPGKRTDPLGDQVSWEQLLDQLRENHPSTLWIVTGDEDYWVPSLDKSASQLLNPMLLREILSIIPDCKVRVLGKNGIARMLNEYTEERGRADERFTEQQIEYYEHLADEEERRRKPWECSRDRENTPILCGTCSNCEAELPFGHGEEEYSARILGEGIEIELHSDTGSDHIKCRECGGVAFNIEFESLCSYCQHVWDSD